MEELKKYLTPSLDILEISEDVLTGLSSEQDVMDDPYGSGNNWWENKNN